jgi:hypothetical protein
VKYVNKDLTRSYKSRDSDVLNLHTKMYLNVLVHREGREGEHPTGKQAFKIAGSD